VESSRRAKRESRGNARHRRGSRPVGGFTAERALQDETPTIAPGRSRPVFRIETPFRDGTRA
jgi:hypothetical protein